MEIKDIIKNRRLELGYTMKDLAMKVGVSEATISRWESGDIANMRRDKIRALSLALKISPSVIMEWDEVQKKDHNLEYHKNTKKERELVTKYRVLDDHGKVVVDTVLQIEYDRVTTDDDVYLNAAHTRTDVEGTDELMKHDDDIMNDPDF